MPKKKTEEENLPSDEIQVIFRKRPVYQPSKNWAKEMGFVPQILEEKIAERKKEAERRLRLRGMSDGELQQEIADSRGISKLTAEWERERRSWRGKLRHVLSMAFLLALGLFCLGAFMWGAVRIYMEQGL